MRTKYLNQQGFTLVEIMIAVGLLGGLALAGASLFKNQSEAQKTVEKNFEVATALSEMRTILADVTNCTATLGGLAVNGGTTTRIRKDINSVMTDVYPLNTQLPGDIRVNSYSLMNTLPGLQANETILRISFSRGKTAIKDEITKNLKIVYTGGPNITSCYAIANNSDSLWQISTVDPNDIFYQGLGAGVGITDPIAMFEVGTLGAFPLSMNPMGNMAGFADGFPNGMFGINLSLDTGPNVFRIQSDGVNAAGVGIVGDREGGMMIYSTPSFGGSNTSLTPAQLETYRRITIDSIGRVGIGTSTPYYGLSVHNNYISNTKSDSVGPALVLTNPSKPNTSAVNWNIYNMTGGYLDSLQFWTYDNDQSICTPPVCGPKVVFMDNGRVGIGSYNPQHKLVVRNENSPATIVVSNPGNGTSMQSTIDLSHSADPNVVLGQAGSTGWSMFARGPVFPLSPPEVNNFGLAYWDGSDWRQALAVSRNLDVAIGFNHVTPTATLDVIQTSVAPVRNTVIKATKDFTGVVGTNVAEFIGLDVAIGRTGIVVANKLGGANFNSLEVWNNNNEVMTVKSNTVGIMNTNPQGTLDVTGSFWTHNIYAHGPVGESGYLILQSGMGQAFWLSAPVDGSFLQIGGAGGTEPVQGAISVNGTTQNVGIGVNNNSGYRLEVNGTVGAPSFVYTSDKKLKTNIRPIENPLEKILALRGVKFDWKKDMSTDIGLIAQEVEKVEPALVTYDKVNDIKSVKYGNIIAIVIEAIKELFSTDEELKKENEELKKRVDLLEARLERLENKAK